MAIIKKIRNEHTGVLTGKGLSYGGSLIRPESTGYGAVYFAAEMLQTQGKTLAGKTVLVSGSGNVAQYMIEKVNDLGGRCISVSDSDGTIIDEHGIDAEKLAYIMDLKNEQHGRIKDYAEAFGATYFEGQSVWEVVRAQGIKHQLAFPSATQNDLAATEAEALIKNGCLCLAEGANMPTTPEAVQILQDSKVLHGPGKAANAGGVSISGLEMSQNSLRLSWSRDEVDQRLQDIMKSIHKTASDAAESYGKPGDYVMGANIAGFTKVAKAMLAAGIV